MKLKDIAAPLIILFCSAVFISWGWVGHSIINYNTIISALPEMEFFNYWADSLAEHASDADYRKQLDPNEAPRHYIDIDNYPEFIESGMIHQNFDSLLVIYGYDFVMTQGVLPWAILRKIDSLQTAFEYGAWHEAMLHASDLGHYIADSHMPLHLTRNYNGQYTNQFGIHSRYESNMIGRYTDQIIYEGDTIKYIDNLSDYVFNTIYDNYVYLDSVLNADSIATAFVGNTTDDLYFEKLWELTKQFTIKLFKYASYKLACLVYTAWVNAGSPVTGGIVGNNSNVVNYELSQNYPNPFNPNTSIKFIVSEQSFIELKVYSSLGESVTTIIAETLEAGDYSISWNAADFPSGIYYYRLQARDYVETKKMVLMK